MNSEIQGRGGAEGLRSRSREFVQVQVVSSEILIQPGFDTVLSACRPPRPDLQYDSRVVVRDHDVVADISVATMRVASRASLASASLTYRSIAEGGNRLPYEYFGD